MALFESISNVASTVSNTLGSGLSGINNSLGRAGVNLSDLSNPVGLLSKLRSASLPVGAEASNIANIAGAVFGSSNGNDWRVRISMPSSFGGSSILQPLLETNGLVFPFTPTISLTGSASYSVESLTHSNYPFVSYTSTEPDQISINGTFYIEDGRQAAYWAAAVHFLRSVTKMASGNTPNQGTPPPICRLNGYGEHVFPNVPVIIKSFTVDLPADVDYIAIDANAAGAGFPSLAQSALGAISQAGGTLGNLASALNTGIGVANSLSGGASAKGWVPTRSTISVTLQPIYSRESIKQFSLQNFVNGSYLSSGKGYL
jgi:hypothetical protein